jgi:hypothetical protein
MTETIALSYDLHLLPRGRISFRRYRYELWHGATLLAAGWCLHPLQAQRAVRIHAVRYAHRLHGLRVIRPDVEHPDEAPWRGRPVTIDWGQFHIELSPVSEDRGAARRVSAGAHAN